MSRLENTIPGFKTLLIEPYTPVIGATVRNIDLNDLKDESTKNELRKALAEFQVLFFREQKLSPDQLIEVAKVFGDPDKAKAFFPRHELHKAIEVLESKSHKFKNYTDQWHADISFSKNPPTGTALYSYIVPNLGGDTVWSSTSAAYESLAIPLQTYLESLVAVHSFENSG